MKTEPTIEKDQTWEIFKEKLLETNGLRNDISNLIKEISEKFPDKKAKEFVAVEMELMCNQLLMHRGTLKTELIAEVKNTYYYDLTKNYNNRETYYANIMLGNEKFHIYMVDYETGEEYAVSLKKKENNTWEMKRKCLEPQPALTYKKRK